jgi:tetratricopeptide (TPR) repeat protein
MSRLEQLKQLAELDPADPLAHYGLGLEHINLEQWPQAIAAFARAIACDARYSAAYYHKARAEIAVGETDAARSTLSQGIEVARQVGDLKTAGEMDDLRASLD